MNTKLFSTQGEAAYRIVRAAVLLALFCTANPLQAKEREMKLQTLFPQGEKLPEKFSKYFIGQAYLAPVSTNPALNCPVFNVTFEAGCRNNWHTHTGGQLLLATNGEGLYQERGQTARLLRPGDAVEIPPNVEHWHGATATSAFAHLAIETNPGKNDNTWLEPVDDAAYAAAQPKTQVQKPRLTEAAVRNHAETLPNLVSTFAQTDPELIETFDNFAFDDIYAQTPSIEPNTRRQITLASLIATGSLAEFKVMLAGALDNGMPPREVKEILYQAVPYIGIAKTLDFIVAANEAFEKRGVALPLPSTSTTDRNTRIEQGTAAQKAIFGDRIDAMRANAPKDLLHIQDDLAGHCFGDTYTRKGLDLKTRELLTFSMLISLGGCEPQVKGHISGNANMGNGRQTLIETVTALLPYIGYPRALNALTCVNEVLPPQETK